jgi:hypothetical protein
MELLQLAKTYLEAEGYQVSQPESDFLTGRRDRLGGDKEFVHVWASDETSPRVIRQKEPSYLTRFGGLSEQDPISAKYFLVPTTEGLSGDFRRDAKKWYRVDVRVPIQFFDTEFSWARSTTTPSATRAFVNEGIEVQKRRVPQPYVLNGEEQSGDIVRTLVEKLRSRDPIKPISLVVGPAGTGKSHMFADLYASLYEAFQSDKRAQSMSRRPLPLLPEILPRTDASSVQSLLRNYLDTDFARPLREPMFEWMMTHGLATWLLDGLDEIIARDQGFVDYILGLATLPAAASEARIVICLRDSLLATQDPLRELVEDYGDGVDTYRLQPWDEREKKYYADLFLQREAPEFLRRISSDQSATELSRTPYYCALLAERFVAGSLRDDYSETSLLSDALDAIIDREYGKRLLDPSLTPKKDVTAFLEELALEDMDGGFQGLTPDQLQDWAVVTLPSALTPDEVDRFSQQMTQLAVFSLSATGRVAFEQEVLEQFLIGQGLSRDLDKMGSFPARLAAWEMPTDSVTVRILAEAINERGMSNEIIRLLGAGLTGTTFRNLLLLLLQTRPPAEQVKRVMFDGQDLSGLIFKDLDFTDVSFRGADLTQTVFSGATLKRSKMEGALLKGTTFSGGTANRMEGADVGDLENFYSIRVDTGEIESLDDARKWFRKVTGLRLQASDPCPAAQQLRFFFQKFVRPNGLPRRASLPRRGVLSGKRIFDPERVLEAAVRNGYLEAVERRDQIARPRDDSYAELVGYASGLNLSPGLRATLSEVCPIKGCLHVPKGVSA